MRSLYPLLRIGYLLLKREKANKKILIIFYPLLRKGYKLRFGFPNGNNQPAASLTGFFKASKGKELLSFLLYASLFF